MRELDKDALDRWITGNYGEDQFRDDHLDDEEDPADAENEEAEVERLKGDPIIIMIANATRDVQRMININSYEFMRAAEEEYRERGGNSHVTIGGPARAIRAILTAENPPAEPPEALS